MGSVVSSENEGPRCSYVNEQGRRCWRSASHEDPTHQFNLAEPKNSGGSSPDEKCKECGHSRLDHQEPTGSYKGQCDLCFEDLPKRLSRAWLHAFVPADAETAGEPEAPHEHDWSEWGAVYHGGHLQWRNCACGATESTPEGHFCPDCAPVCKAPNGCLGPSACHESCAFADQLKGVRLMPRPDPEPEAPECAHESWEERSPNKNKTKVSRWCADCGEYLGRFAPSLPIEEVAEPIGPASLRRPPYAVAYAIEGGAQYEIALPGDATVRAVDGALVITHDKPVLAMDQVRPMET